MFSSRISTPISSNPESEDIFESALSTLFTDVTQNSHGDPGASVTYHSPRFGPVTLRIPTHPDVEDGRKLFAHYLWNAGVIAADAIEVASRDEGDSGMNSCTDVQDKDEEEGVRATIVDWDKRYWNVRGKAVLELGAATALPSVISALSGAVTVTITDHPSSPALTMGAIEQNIRENVTNRKKISESLELTGQSPTPTPSSSSLNPGMTTTSLVTAENTQVLGYAWGTNTMYTTQSYGKPASPQPQPGTYDRIVIADCLWMPSQHGNIVKTILRYLVAQEDDTNRGNHSSSGNSAPSHQPQQPPPPCALVVAGFHTGRGIVRNFFGIATGEWEEDTAEAGQKEEEKEEDEDPELAEVSGKLQALEMFEIDVDGNKRPWEPTREGETKDQAKRWCVCAVLGRR